MRLRDPSSERVLVLAPIGRDAETLCSVLCGAGIAAERCNDADALRRGVEWGAGAALIAEEALSPRAIAALNACLHEQQPWSDLPIVLVSVPGEPQEARVRALKLLEPGGNVAIVERPFQKRTLVSLFEAALRARRRQYQMRDAMGELVRAEQQRVKAEAVRRSLGLYRALARNYPNGFVLLVDAALRCAIAEGQGLAALALSREAAEGRVLGDVFPAATAQRLTAGCRAALAGEEATGEVRCGGRVHLVHYVPLRETGEGPSAMVVTQDVTDQQRASEQLRADALFRERFLGVLAHDLRSPLQAISVSIHAFAKPVLASDKVRAAADRIGRAADRMGRMIRDLLDLTRERQGGGIPIAPAPADVGEVARGAVEEIQAASPGRRILLTIDGDMRGEWDPDRLSQVVSNLVGNAVAYSPPDTPVSVDLRAEGEGVVLSVHNLGDPIPPELMATLFDPFKRAPARGAREPARRGLGLGLFIADRIVQAHGGKVSVTSTAEQGTTFRVTLPRRPPAVTTEAAPARADASRPVTARPKPNGEVGRGRRRVLVVDDDDGTRAALREMLEEAGYSVTTAADGREALELLSSGARPCVVLLDMTMPVMSGGQLLQALRERGQLEGLPVLAVSTPANAGAPPPGVRGCLTKPIHLENLLAAVHESCA